MMSRPVVNGIVSSGLTDAKSTLSIIFIDNTASNNGFINSTNRSSIIESNLDEVLNQLDPNSNLILMTQSMGVIYKGLKKNISKILPINILKPSMRM